MENPSANGAWDAVPKDLGVAAKEWPLSESTQRIRRVFIISAWIRIVLAPVPLMLLVYTAVKIGPSCGFEDLDCLVIARSNLFMAYNAVATNAICVISLIRTFRGRHALPQWFQALIALSAVVVAFPTVVNNAHMLRMVERGGFAKDSSGLTMLRVLVAMSTVILVLHLRNAAWALWGCQYIWRRRKCEPWMWFPRRP